jgi:hypothetical protein
VVVASSPLIATTRSSCLMGDLRHIAEVIEEMKPLEVELPVCPVPECRHVGKHPGQRRMQFDCTGPPGAVHKRVKMVLTVFREVAE